MVEIKSRIEIENLPVKKEELEKTIIDCLNRIINKYPEKLRKVIIEVEFGSLNIKEADEVNVR